MHNKLIHIRRVYRDTRKPQKGGLGALSELDSMIQKALDERQKNKDFKDVGERVAGSRKEKAQYSMLLTTKDLAEIEKDSVLAEKMVVKARVYPEVDVAQERENGTSSGAAYLKVKIRAACAAQSGINSAVGRLAYVKLIESIVAGLADCKTVGEIRSFVRSVSEIMLTKGSSDLIGIDEDDLPRDFLTLRKEFDAKRTFLAILGKNFYNLFFKNVWKSESARTTWGTAERLESDETGNWRWFEDKKETKETEKSGEAEINKGIPLAFIKRVGGLKIDDSLIESSADTDPSENPITALFGFQSVQYGNYMDNAQSKETIRHFLGAVADLSEILNIDIFEFNEFGGLSIAFGARGKGKAMAHYERGYKIINLTKGKGDGSLAHEWAHYLDNMLMMKVLPKEKTKMLTEEYKRINTHYTSGNSSGPVVDSIERIMSFILLGRNGKDHLNSIVKRIPARRSDYAFYISSNRGRSKQQTVIAYGGIAETIAFYEKELSPAEFNAITTDNSPVWNVKSAIVRACGLPYYDFTEKLSDITTFCYYSRQMKSNYWATSVELFARAWECYVFDKLAAKGRSNNYLVSEACFEIKGTGGGPVYPEGKERAHLLTLFDDLILTIKRQYQLKDFKPFTVFREDEYQEIEITSPKPADNPMQRRISELLALQPQLLKI